jgi:gas vesicle protein
MSFKKTKRSSTKSKHHSANSSFLFGLILGAVVGAFIAILIYRHNKGHVFDRLQQKLKAFFQDLADQQENKNTRSEVVKLAKKRPVKKTTTAKKKPVTEKVVTFVKKKPSPKMFTKIKR